MKLDRALLERDGRARRASNGVRALKCSACVFVLLATGCNARRWCFDKPNATPAAWVCEDTELACYKRLAQTRADMRFPNGPAGADAYSPADPYAIWCVELSRP